jgi:hypothetical protein
MSETTAVKITELTEEQKALFPVYRDKWIKIGLQTGPGDRDKAEDGVRKAYMAVDLEPPEKMVWVTSPYAGQLEAKKYADNSIPIYGQHFASWLSFYDYFDQVVGVKNIEAIRNLIQVAENCCWWWAFDKLAILSQRADELHLDERGRLHHESKMAIRYPDDWGVYSWHGVRVPEKVITDPDSLTIDEIKNTENIEVRRVMIERFGVGKYLKEIDASIVDMDASPVVGGAPRVLMQDENGMQFLCGTDGSTKRVYFMSVPDDVKTCREAHEAISGISEEKLIAES